MSPKTVHYIKTIPSWVLPIAVGAALSIAAWSHTSLFTLSNRVTAVETSNGYRDKAIDELNENVKEQTEMIRDIRDYMRDATREDLRP